ncbi:GTP cyclohydrolase I FolE [Microbacterium kribbense]|uniref:GTP cyclohydrolase 1 n=1 Tax=Microbacterium kribbense TaxID=433645 RepID=A0ABP7G383_9MICO
MPPDPEPAGEQAVRMLLRASGVDPDDPVLARTPQRVAATFAELFAGVHEDETAPLRHGDAVPRGTQVVALNDFEFRSICAHHLLPFSGTVSIAYSPVERIVGIGSIIRTLEILSTRPQLQEHLTQQFADAIVAGAGASGALVAMEARHSCIADRGPREAASRLRTIAAAGDLVDGEKRREALRAIHG